jgi:threonine aldolase
MPVPRDDYTFASDNSAGLAPEALAALNAANAGCAPSYGGDEWTARARALIRETFATDCEVFFLCNGTATNALGLAQLCRSYHSIICHQVSHVQTDECGAPEFFTGGAKTIPVAGADAKLRPADVERAIRHRTDVHFPKAGALSLTQATEWGTVYAPDEVCALCAVAKFHGLAVQMDGIRFANAAARLTGQGHTPADFTWRAGIDVLSFGGTKNGMSATDAVVFFNRELARDFAYRVKQSAQLGAKQRFATAQWCGMLENGAWLRHAAQANAMAQKLAAALRRLPGVTVLGEPEANSVFVEMPAATAEALHARGWHFYFFDRSGLPHGHRLMCSWATRPADVERFAADLLSVL